MSDDWVMIFSSNHEFDVELWKVLLNEEGIVSFILDKRDSAYRLGEIELYVKQADALLAKNFIAKRQTDE